MAIVRNWVADAAEEIAGVCALLLENSPTRDGSRLNLPAAHVVEIIDKHCPFKRDTAYVELPKLAPHELKALSIAAVAASSEAAFLLGLIERLAGIEIRAADERPALCSGSGARVLYGTHFRCYCGADVPVVNGLAAEHEPGAVGTRLERR
jgi:hypothetical protein